MSRRVEFTGEDRSELDLGRTSVRSRSLETTEPRLVRAINQPRPYFQRQRHRCVSKTLATAIQFPKVGTRFLVVLTEQRRLALCEEVLGLQLLDLAVDCAKLGRPGPVTEPSGTCQYLHHRLEHRSCVRGRTLRASPIACEWFGMGDEAKPG